jgi:methylated-DNA-[protein]-cysteine S-methyltransferase
MNANVAWLSFPSPVGALTAFAVNNRLAAIEWGRAPEPDHAPTPLLTEVRRQLDQYFDAKRESFDLPLAPAGGDFQQAVWRAMCEIPYGATRTYGDLATALESSARAVGTACGKNPIPIVIPCHRVVGAKGKLTGYSGGAGVETKAYLLRLEGNSLV